ncbi:MAG: SurA N-terminal domain-containing protein [Brevinematales bacterium]|nr:SurA N-terminal domain-containing protein [Brevinematales bacterium]
MQKNSVGFSLSIGIAIGLCVGLAGGALLMKLLTPKTHPSLEMFNPLPKTKGTNWVAQVGEYTITQEDLDRGLQLFLSQVPANQRAQILNNPSLKSQLLEEFINQYVVLMEALKDKAFDTPENRFLIQASVRQAVYQLYLKSRLPADTSVFLPTEAEINAFYEQNRAQLSRMNIPASQMKQFIQQELGNRKLQEWAARYVMQLREGYPIKRNTQTSSTDNTLSPLPLQK